MRLRIGVLAASTACLVACSGSHSRQSAHPSSSSAATRTLKALWDSAGPHVALVEGTSDYAPGTVRLSFLVVAPNGKSVERRHARVWVARGLNQVPFARTSAALEPIGVSGGYTAGHGVTNLYVTHLRFTRPGKYWVLAVPIGGKPIQALGNIVVRTKTLSPSIGSKAIPSRTPTLASVHGDLSKLTTRVPPDRALLRYSIAGSLEAHKPFVVVFATPKFCASRTCGPVVDVVDAVRKRFAKTDIRFIHVEIYKDNDPAKGFNRWVKEWHLPTEPWVFLVGRDGRIQAKFEGSISVPELSSAIRRALL